MNNIGDILFIIIGYGIPLLFIVLIIMYFKNVKQIRIQLQNLEEKIEDLNKKNKV